MKKLFVLLSLSLTIFACTKENEITPQQTFEDKTKDVVFYLNGSPIMGFPYLFRSTIYYLNNNDTIFINKNTFNYPINDSCKIEFDAPVDTKVIYNFDMFRGTTSIWASVNGDTALGLTVRAAANCQYLKGEFNIN